MNVNKVFDCKCDINGVETTIKEYLKSLLSKLWAEKDGFNGKRPFGNSAWEYDLYYGLFEDGLVEGERDEDGYIDEIDEDKANKLILEAIKAL